MYTSCSPCSFLFGVFKGRINLVCAGNRSPSEIKLIAWFKAISVLEKQREEADSSGMVTLDSFKSMLENSSEDLDIKKGVD